MGSDIANYTYCVREKVPRTRAQIWASHPAAEVSLRDITQWGHLSPMSSLRRLSLLHTSQERRSVVASWSSQTDDLVVRNPKGNLHDQTSENRDNAIHRAHEPTKTAQTPPNPPATKAFTFSAAADAAEMGAFVIVLLAVACSVESPL